MARHCFFSFHYQRDIFRVSQVRNSWVTQGNTVAGFWDSANWEKVLRQGPNAIENWIENQLKGTSVIIVLIGTETAQRKYVKHEISRSYALGKGMLGIYIHNCKNQNGQTSTKGENPFSKFHVEERGKKIILSEIYPTYDWVTGSGYTNLGTWIEKAAKAAGK